MRKTRQRFGWLLALLGAVFLIAGLLVLVFATMPLNTAMPRHAPMTPQTAPSMWVTLADHVMHFVLALLSVQWTPTRVGVFLVLIGLGLEGGAGYLLLKK